MHFVPRSGFVVLVWTEPAPCLGAPSLPAELSVKIRLFESMLRGPVPYQYALCEWVWGGDSLWAHRTLCATEQLAQHSFTPVSACVSFLLHTSLLSSPQTHFPSLRVNVGCGPAEERVLLTGLHAVADIYCENCKTTLGWKYVSVIGWFDAPQHKLHPRLEDDKLGGRYYSAP